jgi:hypothetical protein
MRKFLVAVTGYGYITSYRENFFNIITGLLAKKLVIGLQLTGSAG